MEPLTVATLVACFGGGVVGAALGGLFAFSLCGLIVLCGALVALTGGDTFLLLQVGVGPLFGPHAGGFTAGVVASTYAAAIRKNHPTGNAKDILPPLIGTSWDVLAIGGITAVLGHLLTTGLGGLPIVRQADCVALSVVILAWTGRLLFQRQMPWGSAESIRKYGYLGTDGGRISWVSWLLPLHKMALFGAAVGCLAGVTALHLYGRGVSLADRTGLSEGELRTACILVWWALAAVSLIGLNFATGSIQRFPVWHCPAILAAIGALHYDHWAAGLVVGGLAILLQELMARLFWNHGSNHVDPPGAAIACGTFILNILP